MLNRVVVPKFIKRLTHSVSLLEWKTKIFPESVRRKIRANYKFFPQWNSLVNKLSFFLAYFTAKILAIVDNLAHKMCANALATIVC